MKCLAWLSLVRQIGGGSAGASSRQQRPGSGGPVKQTAAVGAHPQSAHSQHGHPRALSLVDGENAVLRIGGVSTPLRV